MRHRKATPQRCGTGLAPIFQANSAIESSIWDRNRTCLAKYPSIPIDLEHQLHPVQRVLAERAGIEPAKDGVIRPLLVL